MFTYAVIPTAAIILPCLNPVNFFPESLSP
jgi:hypothetical protein